MTDANCMQRGQVHEPHEWSLPGGARSWQCDGKPASVAMRPLPSRHGTLASPVTPPQLGDRVHYVSHGTPLREDGTQEYESKCRAALVTEVQDARFVGLVVFSPEGLFFPQHVLPYDPSGGGGTWHLMQVHD
jgi:hypothetical protein